MPSDKMHELMMNIGLVGKVHVEFVASDLYFERRESSGVYCICCTWSKAYLDTLFDQI